MTTAYTSLLGLALPVTGELSGTWGDTVNTAITSLLDTAVAGTTSITTDADITLTTTTGASNQARQAIILWNPASGTTTRNITAPAQSKIYTVINASGGTQSIVIRGVGPTTGVTVLKGESALVAWNGSDFVKVSSIGGSLTLQDLTVTGNTILGDAAADTLTVNATSTFNAPVSFAGQVKLPSTGRSAAAALTPTNPAFLYGVASTYTDTTSSGTLAPVASFYGLAQPTLSTSNVTTYTSAATLYIANAPTTGGSATITNPYALYVAAGTTYLAGNVGVGATPTTGYRLSIADTTAKTQITSTTGTNLAWSLWTNTGGSVIAGIESSAGGAIFSGTGAYSAVFGHSGGYPVSFATSNTERMRITSGGVVGIGTNIPATFANALTVQGITALVGNASFTSSNPTYQGILRLIENPTTIASTGGLEFFTSNFGSGYGWKMTSIDSSGVQLTFATRANSATWSEVMRLDSSGNVSIGTSSGSARLNVNGGTSTSQIRWEVNNAAFVNEVSTNAAVNAYVYKSNDASYHVWKISSSTAMTLDSSGRMFMSSNAAYGNAKITLVPATNPTTGLSTNSQIQIGESTSNSAYCLNIGYGLFGDYYGYIQSKNNSVVTSLLLNPDGGNVGIGTTSPVYRLAVTGASNTGIASFSGNNNGVIPGSDGDATLVIGGNYASGSAEVDYFHNNSTFKGTIGGHRFLQRTGASTTRDLMWLTENLATFYTGGSERMRINSSGDVLVTSAAGLGYGTGSGGTVTQATDKSTSVTLNKPTGQITMNNAALLPTATAFFPVSNSLITASDTVIVSQNTTGVTNVANYSTRIYYVSAGAFGIAITNISAGSLSEACVLNFTIIKGATA
jgi:hypothetical protein